MSDHDEEIGVNRPVATTLGGFAVVALVLFLVAPSGSADRFLMRAGLVFVVVGVVVIALRSRPGASIVLGADELRVRGLIRWRSIAYTSITRLGEVRGMFGGLVSRGGQFDGIEGQYLRVHVEGGRSVRITALQSAMPLTQLRSILVERVHHARSRRATP